MKLIDSERLREALHDNVDLTWFNHLVAPILDAQPAIECGTCKWWGDAYDAAESVARLCHSHRQVRGHSDSCSRYEKRDHD